MPTPIPLDPKEFHLEKARMAAVIYVGLDYCNDPKIRNELAILYSKKILEEAGLVEGVEETKGYSRPGCGLEVAPGGFCMRPNPCDIHTPASSAEPETCPGGAREGMSGGWCGNHLPCPIHG
jgi:hypothetical protein